MLQVRVSVFPVSLVITGISQLLKECSVTKSCSTLFNPTNCSKAGSLSFTVSQSLLKLMSTELVMPSNHLIHCPPLFLPSTFPSIRVFSNGQSIGASASASILPVNIQGWFPLGLTVLILQPKGLERMPVPRNLFHRFTKTYILHSKI